MLRAWVAPAALQKPAAFEHQQRAFSLDSPCISNQRAGGADHPMARDHDRDGVLAVGLPHRAGIAADATGYVAVRTGGSMGNFPQCAPHGVLERRPGRGDRNLAEIHWFAAEIAGHGAGKRRKRFIVATRTCWWGGVEPQTNQRAIGVAARR